MAHIDCQAQLIGSYGYQSLGQPGSVASTVVASLLTLFIAFYGFRLLFGPPPSARDLVTKMLKIGVVLALGFSWPAFRTVFYDLTLKGPGEIAAAILPENENMAERSFLARLQEADNSILRLTEMGAGRNTSALVDNEAPGGTFESAALDDENSLGSARLFYLASVIGTLGLLRIAAGLLLALAPLVAGLYFLSQSRGIFAGWLKGIVMTVAGSIGATTVLSVQLAILNPWLADALRVRALGYATPAAPTELYAIMLAFGLLQLVMLWFLAKVVFYRGWSEWPDIASASLPPNPGGENIAYERRLEAFTHSRAERISDSIAATVRRERHSYRVLSQDEDKQFRPSASEASATSPNGRRASFRRSNLRISSAARRRDAGS